jgi:hypothetical protein
MRFECISKQWQRFIFNRQQKLRISYIKSIDTIDGLIVSDRNVSRFHSINRKALEMILKKFRFITDIRIDGRLNFDHQILDIISKNCNNLKNLSITARYIEDIPQKSLINFGLNCGQKLESIKLDAICDHKIKTLLKMTPNLKSLTVVNISTIIDEKNESKAILGKLRDIHFSRCSLNLLKQFVLNYSSSIRKIRTHLLTLGLKENHLNYGLIEFSHFQKLESLDLFIDVCHEESDMRSIDEGLKQIGLNCLQLKRLSFTMDGNLINGKLFNIFGQFISLKYCEINIICDTELAQQSYDSCDYGTIASFKNCLNLVELSLHLEQLTDDHLIDINLYLPQLTQITINSSKTISDKTLNSLSKIKNLSKIDITCYTSDDKQNITDSAISNIIKNCSNIRNISFDQKNSNFDFSITKASEKLIIDLAKDNPKHLFNFSYAVNQINSNNDNKNSRHNTENKSTIDLPQNLNIEIL